jgi:hypothetical protein
MTVAIGKPVYNAAARKSPNAIPGQNLVYE